ncbi:zinc finger protein 501 [Sardina pilchardus]|uniref:zinc finger protein 501 n=1 Tax=Sardina pilchardus TaxID=27697 RepID=UPI002E155FD8
MASNSPTASATSSEDTGENGQNVVPKLYSCSECGQSFGMLVELQIHKKSRHVTKRLSTFDLFGKGLSTACTPTRPKRAHTKLKAHGSSCEKSFVLSSGLMQCKRSHASELPYSCTVCPKTFVSSTHLALHLRSHCGERRFKCSICAKVFLQSSHLARHKAIHTGEKPFKCPDCGKSFGRASHLKTHLRLHTGEKPFECTVCEKTFTQKAGLIMHHRQHTEELPFRCNRSSKGLHSSTRLLSHRALESGEKSFRGCRCGEIFRTTLALRQHERRHKSHESFGCGVCQTPVVRSSCPQLGTRAGERAYHCMVCNRMFTEMSTFERHCGKHLQQSGCKETKLEKGREWETKPEASMPMQNSSSTISRARNYSEVTTRSKTRAKARGRTENSELLH